MQLSSGERAILSYCHTYDLALKAKEELSQSGFDSVTIDRIPKSSWMHNLPDESGHLSSWYQSITNSIQEESNLPKDLLRDGWDGYDYMLTVIAPRQTADHALSIVKKYAYIVN